jgi:S1-C subfamily serine protease
MMARFGWTALCVTVFAILFFLSPSQIAESRHSLAAPVLKVLVNGGHGTGVHIGNGYIITAAHVVKDAHTLSVKRFGGESEDAEVLWANAAYDVALMRMKGRGPQAPLFCDRAPSIGDNVVAVGNPGPLEFIHSFGRVASDVATRLDFRASYIASIAISGGSSGGPVFDENGRVVGIAVAVAVASLGGFYPSQNGLAYVVPAHKGICTLMGNDSEVAVEP